LPIAETLARRVLKADPNHLNANLTLGLVLLAQDKPQEALAALQLAEKRDPGSPKVQYQLSRAYSLLNRPEESRKHVVLYQQALKDLESRLKRARGIME
jgi:predicted Zn-dependent protease